MEWNVEKEWVSGNTLTSLPCCFQVVSSSLQPHGLQHARLPWPSPTPGVCSNSCPLSQWRHPTNSSSVPFSSCPQSFPASGSLLMSQLITAGGQSIGASASASVLAMNIQSWFPLRWIGLILLQSRDFQESSLTPQFESINYSALSLLYGPILTSVYDYLKNHSFDYTNLCWKPWSLQNDGEFCKGESQRREP